MSGLQGGTRACGVDPARFALVAWRDPTLFSEFYLGSRRLWNGAAALLVVVVALWWVVFHAPLWMVPDPPPPSLDSTRRQETVVLLHGMGRTRASMALLGRRLYQEGYDVFLFGYNPRAETLDELSLRLKDYIADRVRTPTYHVIGHSLGNIIVRNGLRWSYRPGLRRIVMIAPPNGPAEMAGGDGRRAE